jgi:hypothetical protein
MYIAIVAIREEQFRDLLTVLDTSRSSAGYGEMHFKKLKNRQKSDLAKLWLKHVMLDSQRRFHFYVLGLRLDHLQRGAFGGDTREQMKAIYNRFFRLLVSYVLRAYFGRHEQFVVSSIFHDESVMKYDRLFDWHTIWKVRKRYDNVSFENPLIQFINSDHRKEPNYPEHSHFIQLADLIVGATKQCLDMTSRKRYKIEVAKEFLPLVERLCNEKSRNNRNSRYDHFERCTVSFFPSKRLTLSELSDPWQRVKSGFFCNRRILLKHELSGQSGLFE